MFQYIDWSSSTIQIYVGRLGNVGQPTDEIWSKEISEAERLVAGIEKSHNADFFPQDEKPRDNAVKFL